MSARSDSDPRGDVSTSALIDGDRHLRAWLASIVDGPVRDGMPTNDPAPSDDDGELTLCVVDLVPETTMSVDVHRSGSAAVWLRHLVCATHPGSSAALGALGVVMARLVDPTRLDAGAPTVQFDPAATTTHLWAALGVAPRPAVVLRTRAVFSRDAALVPRVTSPLRVVGGPVLVLRGRLVGPGEVPLVGADVSVPAVGASARTAPDGSFVLAGVPSGPLAVAVRAKGRSFDVDLDAADSPHTVRCDPREDRS